LLTAPSSLALNASKKGASTASLTASASSVSPPAECPPRCFDYLCLMRKAPEKT